MYRYTYRWSLSRHAGRPSGEFTAEAESYMDFFFKLSRYLIDEKGCPPLAIVLELELEMLEIVEVPPPDEPERLARLFWETFHAENLKWMESLPYHDLFAKATPYEDLGEGYQGALKVAVVVLLREKQNEPAAK